MGQADGVILRLKDQGEYDQVLTLITKDGPLRGIAKGAKRSIRRFGGRIETLNRVTVEYTRKKEGSLAVLKESVLTEYFEHIPENLIALARCLYLGEFIEASQGEGEGMFNLYLGFLRRANAGKATEEIFRLTELKLLAYLGYCPSLSRCASCGESISGKARFSFSKGGSLCPRCQGKESLSAGRSHPEISLETIRALEKGLGLKDKVLDRLKFSKKSLLEAHEIFPAFIRYTLERDLKSLRFIEKIANYDLPGTDKKA